MMVRKKPKVDRQHSIIPYISVATSSVSYTLTHIHTQHRAATENKKKKNTETDRHRCFVREHICLFCTDSFYNSSRIYIYCLDGMMLILIIIIIILCYLAAANIHKEDKSMSFEAIKQNAKRTENKNTGHTMVILYMQRR